MKIVSQNVEIINMNHTGKQIEYCGRICYNSYDKINENSWSDFVSRCINRGHTSILEFGLYFIHDDLSSYRKHYIRKISDNLYMTNFRAMYVDLKYPSETLLKLMDTEIDNEIKSRFLILKIRTNRAISHQLVRHRTFSFLQRSDRYVRRNELVIIPPVAKSLKLFADIEVGYLNLLTEYPPQTARMVLPQCVETEILMGGYHDNWIEFLKLRNSPKADPQMQELAKLIDSKVKEWFD